MNDDPVWQRYWRYLSRRFQRDIREEVGFHLEQRAKELEAGGLPADSARREALRRFGNPKELQERLEQIEWRRGRRLTWAFRADELGQDIRYGIRGLLKRPGFTLTTTVSLALGLAAVTVALSLVNTWVLKPLPAAHAGELVVIGAANRATRTMPSNLISLPTVRDIAARHDLFRGAAAHMLTVVAARRPEASQGRRRMLVATTGNYFSVLGVSAALGRVFSPDDDLRRDRVIVLGYSTWQRVFGADPAVIGAPIYLNTVPFVIIGVTAEGFQGTDHIFSPFGFVPAGTLGLLDLALAGIEERREAIGFKVIARSQPGVSTAAIQAGLDVLTRQLASSWPELDEGYRLIAVPESRARPTLDASAGTLSGVMIFTALALLVLLTAVVNVTNLILARGSTRQTELAVRQAVGASRGRLIRQLVTETMLLALLGLAGGWFLARLAVGALTAIPIDTLDLPLALTIAVDWRVFGLAVVVSLAVGLLAGIGPAAAVSRFDLHHRLREGARTGLGRRGQRVRSTLVVLQVAASMVVLISVGLFAASVRQAARIDLGFRPDHLVTLGLDATLAHYSEPKARTAFDQIERRVQEQPGVLGTAWANSLAMNAGRAVGGLAEVEAEGTTQASRKGTLSVLTSAVSASWFDVVEMPILEGRSFLPTDDSAHAPVAIVNRQAADLLWPGRSPIGQMVRLTRGGMPVEVVGVVKISRYLLIGERPRPYLYLPLAQQFSPFAFLYVRTRQDPSLLLPEIPKVISSIDRDLVPFGVNTMEGVIEKSLNGMLLLRLGSGIASALGGLALILTGVGLYGIVAYSVAQRHREIGLRMALGADRWKVVRSVLIQGGRLAAIGIGIGAVIALLTTRALAGLVVNVSVTDGTIFTVVAAGLLLVALASAYIPARRAARIDPVRALKDDGAY